MKFACGPRRLTVSPSHLCLLNPWFSPPSIYNSLFQMYIDNILSNLYKFSNIFEIQFNYLRNHAPSTTLPDSPSLKHDENDLAQSRSRRRETLELWRGKSGRLLVHRKISSQIQKIQMFITGAWHWVWPSLCKGTSASSFSLYGHLKIRINDFWTNLTFVNFCEILRYRKIVILHEQCSSTPCEQSKM